MFKKLGIAFTVFTLLVVVGCSAAGEGNDDVVQRAIPAALNVPTHTPTNIPTSTLTPNSTPSPTSTTTPCFRLLSPENGIKLTSTGKVTFAWEIMQGAVRYKLEIIPPSSQSVFFEMSNTSRDQYLEAFQMGGVFEWKVTAFDASGTAQFYVAPSHLLLKSQQMSSLRKIQIRKAVMMVMQIAVTTAVIGMMTVETSNVSICKNLPNTACT